MQKLLAISAAFILWSTSAFSMLFDSALELDVKVFGAMPFVHNDSPTYFGTYLIRNVPFDPIYRLKNQLEKNLNRPLIDRQEAHITVVTPPEYELIKDIVSINDIHAMIEDSLQDSKFEPICVGRGSAQITGNLESTYFVVVRADDLLEVRRQIAALFYSRGGDRSGFDPEVFYPHITVGYTKRDLHMQDGVIKNQSSCIADIQMIEH